MEIIPPTATVNAINKTAAIRGLRPFILNKFTLEEYIKVVSMEEKIITLNLKKATLRRSRRKRRKIAIAFIKKFLERSIKKEVKIDKSINEKIWKEKIPNKIRIKLIKENENYKAILIE